MPHPKAHIEHPLLVHIGQFVHLDPGDFSKILSSFENKKARKREHLMTGDSICDTHYFVLKGCLNMYYIHPNGAKQTIQFAIENWWLTDYLAYGKKNKTEFFIQAVEPTTVLALDYEAQEKLLDQFPKLETYFRKVYQIAYGSSLMRVKYQYELSKEEIYLHFIQNFPDFAQRVPQYLIASFLGLTPEYVSEIRKKRFS